MSSSQSRFRLTAALFYFLPLLGVGQDYFPPRTEYGDPDFQGIWQALNTAVWDIQDHPATLGVPAGQGVVIDGEIPYQAWAVEQRKENYKNRLTNDPEASSFQVAYTMGGASIRLMEQDVKNQTYGSATTADFDATIISLGLAF